MGDGIDKNQLELLMDSYRQQIELNTKLLERQSQFVERLDNSTKALVEAIHTQTESVQSVIATGIAQLGQKITEEHGAISLRIYIALGGMVSLLATLIAMWVMS